VCSNGQLAIASITSFSPDLILMDARMPYMNGLTTSRLLREMKETAQIPVIFVTANTQPADMEKYRELGAIGVISKPFEVATLASTIRVYWNERFKSRKAS
jgi:two-component system OmpR family response regulator